MTEARSCVAVSMEGEVATITLSGEGYDLENITALGEAIARLSELPMMRAIVIQGTRDSFWLGASPSLLVKMSEGVRSDRFEIVRRGQANVRCILQSPKLIVAYVDGFAAGGGVDLMLACDLVLVTNRSRVNLFYGKLGVVPDHGGLFLLAQHLGWARALRCAESCPSWSAPELLQLGLAEREVPAGIELGSWERVLRREMRVPVSMRSALKAIRWSAISPEIEAHFVEVADLMADLLGLAEQRTLLAKVRAMQAITSSSKLLKRSDDHAESRST